MIKLSPSNIIGKELQYIKEAIEANELSSRGNSLKKFNQALINYLGENKEIALLNSGTSAIHMALILAGIKKGDLVLCQTATFAASVFPVVYQNATPVFVDSEKYTWNVCPIALEEAIVDKISKGQKPKAIIVVHLYGMPAKMDAILSLAKKYNIILIEDAAEALGSTYKSQKCGTFGDFGVLSFNANKIITTSGGGALICKNKELKGKAVFLASQAKDEKPHYEHSSIGFNYRMSNIQASIGMAQMEFIDDFVSAKRSSHNFYKDFFKLYEYIEMLSERSEVFYSNHWLNAIVIKENEKGVNRDYLISKLKEKGIETRPLWKPMHLQPIFKNCDYYGNQVSEYLFTNGLCLPSGSNLKDVDRDYIKTTLQKIL